MEDFSSTCNSGHMCRPAVQKSIRTSTTATYSQHQFHKPSLQQSPKDPFSALHSTLVSPTRPLQHSSTFSKQHHSHPRPSYRPASPSQTLPVRDQMRQILHLSTGGVSQRARKCRARELEGEREVLRTHRKASCMSSGIGPWWL